MTGLNLTAPTDHADPYVWLVVLLAHAALGLALTGAVAALLDRIGRGWIEFTALDAWILTSAAYGLLWEVFVQRIGAGWADAAVDTLAVSLGGAVGALAWRRRGPALAGAMLALAAIGWRGVRARK